MSKCMCMEVTDMFLWVLVRHFCSRYKVVVQVGVGRALVGPLGPCGPGPCGPGPNGPPWALVGRALLPTGP